MKSCRGKRHNWRAKRRLEESKFAANILSKRKTAANDHHVLGVTEAILLAYLEHSLGSGVDDALAGLLHFIHKIAHLAVTRVLVNSRGWLRYGRFSIIRMQWSTTIILASRQPPAPVSERGKRKGRGRRLHELFLQAMHHHSKTVYAKCFSSCVRLIEWASSPKEWKTSHKTGKRGVSSVFEWVKN